MRPLFSYLRTRMAATAVFAGPQDWGNTDDGGAPLSSRIDRAAAEFAGLLAGEQPGRKPAAPESLPFEQLLADISGGR
jgi:FMN reductase